MLDNPQLYKELESKKIELEQEKVNLEIQKIADQQEAIPFKRYLKNYGSLAALGTALISALIVSWGLYHKYSVHEIRIGKHSTLKVRYKDLGTLGTVQNGLVLSEQLKHDAKTEQRGFEMSLKLAQIVTDQLRALSGRGGLFRQSQAIDMIPEQPALPVHVPTFAELVEMREIALGKPLIYGYHRDTGRPEKGPLKEQYSIFTIGMPGFGKTTHAVYFIASAVLAEQASFDVLDWHYPDEESLGYALGDLVNTPYVNLVTNPFDLPDLLQDYRNDMTQRARMSKDSYQARILVVDENETWVKNVKELAQAESNIINEGRKFKLYVLITSKSAKADKMGGDSDIKNQCTTSYCFRTKPQNAKTFFQDTEKEKLVKQLKEPGECVFTDRKNNSAIVTIPFTTRRDMNAVCDLIIDGNTIQKATLPEMAKHNPIPKQEDSELDQAFDEILVAKKDNVVELHPKKSTPDQEMVLHLLNQFCDVRPEGMSKNQWQKQVAQEIGISYQHLKNVMLKHGGLSDDLCVKIADYLKTIML
jgi:hypothetical protein